MSGIARGRWVWALLVSWACAATPVWALAEDADLDLATATRQLHAYGQLIDEGLRLHARGHSLENIEDLLDEPDDMEVFEAMDVLGRQLVCSGDVHGLLAQIDAWDDRIDGVLKMEASAEHAPDPSDLDWVRQVGMQPLLLRFVVSQAHGHCPQAALRTFDQAVALPAGPLGGDPLLREAMHALTRAGLALAAGERIGPRALLQPVQVVERGAPEFKEAASAYRSVLDEVALSGQTPRWDVDPTRAWPRLEQRPLRGCGFAGLFSAWVFPQWPHPVLLLEAQGQADAAAAWALAALFKEGGAHDTVAQSYDPAALVRRVYGQTSVRAALQQAAADVQVRPHAEGTLAWITLYGHSFVIPSGTPDEIAEDTQRWSTEDIRAHLQSSSAWQRLWGEDPAAPGTD